MKETDMRKKKTHKYKLVAVLQTLVVSQTRAMKALY